MKNIPITLTLSLNSSVTAHPKLIARYLAAATITDTSSKLIQTTVEGEIGPALEMQAVITFSQYTALNRQLALMSQSNRGLFREVKLVAQLGTRVGWF